MHAGMTRQSTAHRRGAATVRWVSILTATLAAASMALAPTPAVGRESRLGVGDSVMLGAKHRLEGRGFAVNTAVSRQVSDGVDLLREKARNGTLRTNVVVHLGTNGTFGRSQCRAMRSVVGKDRRLFLVTVLVPRAWEAGNNRVIRRCASRFSHVYLVDWRRFASSRSGLVESDGYHLTARGARKYAALVDRTVDEVVS